MSKKKLTAIILLTVSVILALYACKKDTVLIEVSDDREYITLPVCGEKLRVDEQERGALSSVSVQKLKEAEEKIAATAAEYGEDPQFYLTFDDEGYLCLGGEIIYDISVAPGGLDKGCGIDHDHAMFEERISD